MSDTRTVIVPNELSDAINAKLDAAFVLTPEAAVDREVFYNYLLSYFDEHGVLPDFRLQKRSDAKCKFCGDVKPLDEFGHCSVCVNGMERTNGD